MAEPARPNLTPVDTEIDAPRRASGRSLAQAVITAVVLILTVIGFYFLGRVGFFWLAAVVVSLALFELADALKRAGHRPSAILMVAGGFALMSAGFLRRPAYLPVVLGVTLVAAFFYALRPTRGDSAVTDVAWTLLGVAWIGGGGTGAVSILNLGDDGVLLLVAVVFTIAIGDIAAYFAGTSFGRHKLAPAISPGKSWEGAIAGFVAAVAAGAAFATFLPDLAPVDGLAIGALCGAFAPVGDLFESMAKREIGVKDSGRLLPGHGGFLDRLDAIIFCAPVTFLYLRFVVF